MKTYDDPTIANGVAQELLSHPLTRRFAIKITASGDNTVHTAADVLGERLLRVAGLLLTAVQEPGKLKVNCPDEDKLGLILRFAPSAMRATPYLWTEQVRGALAQATPLNSEGHLVLPRHVVSPRILPEPAMWWTFETAISITDQATHGIETSLDLQLIQDVGEGFAVFTVGTMTEQDQEERTCIELRHLAYGKTFPDDYTDPGELYTAESLLAFLAFLNSPHIPKRQDRLLRSERREIQRRQAPDFGTEVTFINLRRPEPQHHHSDENSDVVQWQHRWLVSGHYRAQWYPSESAHHVIWIAPHLKGPPDAPLLEHAYRVVR